MQMRILALRIVLVLGRETHIFYGLPVASASFDVTAVIAVPSIPLNNLKQFLRHFERILIACGPGIFRKAVKHKALRIKLFLGVERFTIGRHAPVCSAKFLIDEMFEDIILRHRCSFQVGLITQNA